MLRLIPLNPAGKAVAYIMIVGIFILSTLVGCSSDRKTTPAVSEFDIVREAVAGYLTDKAGNVNAADLHAEITNGTVPYIVSLRSADDYANGHIPNAVNYTFGNLSDIPEEEEIVIYCYTGQSSSFGTAVLGVLGYDVRNLLNGMSSWTTDPDIYKTRFDPTKDQSNYKVETTLNEGLSYKYPNFDNTISTIESDIINAAVATVSPKYITSADLNTKIDNGEGMTILSVRSVEHYAAGHIPGAINIGLDNLAENLNKLNPDSPVYVYCYTGHSSAQAAALLQMLGYDAYSLKYGMCSWSSDPAVNAGKCFDPSAVTDYTIE